MATAAQIERQLKDVAVAREGDKIVVPSKVSLDAAITALQRRRAEENEDIGVDHKFHFCVPEGAVAFVRALQELHGFVNPTATPTFFGPEPPVFTAVAVSATETVMVPMGRLRLPEIEGYVEASWYLRNMTPYFRFTGVVKGKDKAAIDAIAVKVREIAARESIYKGKAVIIPFPEEPRTLEDFTPSFMSVQSADENALIFSDEIADLVRVTLFTPITHTTECRKQRIPLKRGILLEGPFGVGKTLTANVTARKCEENGWTFIYVDNVKNLKKAIEFARQYQPAVVFAEDIDQVLDGERDSDVNDILNCIDGIGAKNTEIITVLTTNNVQKITQAMLRPGRLDTVIPVRAPDAGAVQRIVRLFAGNLMDENEDLTRVGEKLAGQIPAVIREAVERSKLSAVRRGGKLQILASDVEVAASGMLAHLKLLEPKAEDTRSERVKAADVLADALRSATPVAKTNGRSAVTAQALD